MTKSHLRSLKTYFCCILLLHQLQLYGTHAEYFKCQQLPQPRNYELSHDGTLVSKLPLLPQFNICGNESHEFNNNSTLELGKCLMCKRIVACIGYEVKQLPNSTELPPDIDQFQVRNSDVRIIPRAAFLNTSITEIYIENNFLSHMHQGAFEGVRGLKNLSLANNNLPIVLVTTFDSLTELVSLNLDANGLEMMLTGDLINVSFYEDKDSIILVYKEPKGLVSLQILSLENNPLRILPKSAFTWLATSRLKYLSLRRCSIETAHPDVLVPIHSTLSELELGDVSNLIPQTLYNITVGLSQGILKRLGLSSTGLVRIPYLALENVGNTLEVLSLQGNTFQRLAAEAFPNMSKLNTIDLRRCSILVLADGAFNGLQNLKTLLLSDNRISNIVTPFSELKNLVYLDLSNNPDPEYSENDEVFEMQTDSFKGLESLSSLTMANSKLCKLQSSMFLPITNLNHLSLCNTQIKNNSRKAFSNLKSLKTLDLSANKKFASILYDDMFKGLDVLQELNFSHCYLQGMSEGMFAYISNLKKLDLTNTEMNQIEPNTFSHLHLLQAIYLNENRIEPWQFPLFKNITDLKYIELKRNQINFFTDVMIEEFANKSISLQNNPFFCDCSLEKFVLETMDSSGITIKGLHSNPSDYVCYDPKSKSNLNLLNMSNSTFCLPIEEVQFQYSIIIIVSSIVIILLLILFVYRKRNNLRYMAISFKNAINIALLEDEIEDEEEVIYNYDVFVSYCEADREWVIQNLLPALERDSQLRVCLHERDFQPGYGILDNIIHCIDKSRTLLIIVSKKSLKSQWCQFEMHLAQHRFLETKREQLILILMNPIPKSERPRTLHYLMATRTYLDWDPDQPGIFWKRLKRVLLWDTKAKKTSVA